MTAIVNIITRRMGAYAIFCARTYSDKLMISDHGVHSDIMDVMDGKPYFGGIHLLVGKN